MPNPENQNHISRKSFLKYLGITALALLPTSALLASSKEKSEASHRKGEDQKDGSPSKKGVYRIQPHPNHRIEDYRPGLQRMMKEGSFHQKISLQKAMRGNTLPITITKEVSSV